MTHEPGTWVKESRVGDCTKCGADSVGIRLLDAGSPDRRATELRRCVDGHEFTGPAWFWTKGLRGADRVETN